MWTLAIDTAGATGSIALSDGSSLYTAELANRSYSAQLVAAVDALFREAGISLSKLAFLAVISGPGSFTGIRIGISVAKAWAETADLKLFAISRLALCAASVSDHDEVRVVLDAGRGEFFFGHYREHGEKVLHEALMKKAELLSTPKSPVPLFVFEQAAAEALAPLHPLRRELPTASDALPLAAHAVAAGRIADPVTLDGNYLRRSDAELFARPAASGARS